MLRPSTKYARKSASWMASPPGGTWTLGAWWEARDDFRNFRVDRTGALAALERRYPDQPGRGLADFLRANSGVLR